ncbi:hypothetical protein HMPREF3189_01021 [Clostridiales bacterium KA00134]|nr:hypothetical protein HMPREF3189_01021 [Clostridiales bacterium KA00134]
MDNIMGAESLNKSVSMGRVPNISDFFKNIPPNHKKSKDFSDIITELRL